MKCWARWIITWNQDFQEKYQQSQICRWYHSNGRKSRGIKESLDEDEWVQWTNWLKIQHQKAKILAYSHITSWQIDGEKIETVEGFIFLGSKIIADSDCSHDIKRHLFLGRIAMTNLDSVLKSRHHHIIKATVFPVVMYRCESWIIKKAECQRIDAFKLWCWRRLLRVPWTAGRSN